MSQPIRLKPILPLLLAALLAGCGKKPAAETPPTAAAEEPLAEAAHRETNVDTGDTSGQDSTKIHLGDVLMRSLRVWPQPKNQNDTLAAAKAFKVDRIVWIYENSEEFNERVRAEGIGIGTTMSHNAREQWINDLSRAEKEEFVARFTVVNLDGEQVIRPHRMRFGRDPMIVHFEPDQSNPEWLELYTDYLVSLYEHGIDTLHRDDPRITVGSILSGGSFTDSAVAFVRKYLNDNFTAQELREMGVEDPETFNIRDHFKALGAPSDESLWKWRGSPLMTAFHDALMEADRQFYLKLKPEVEARAGYSVPWSLNGMGPINPHEAAFDFRIGEFQSHFNQPQTILLLNDFMHRAGKTQAFVSMVDGQWETNEAFVSDLRRHIPSAYATGAIPLVPWCMYMHAAPRYYGTVEEFGDLFHFVSANRHYFDEHELLSVSGIDTSAKLYSWMPNREMVYHKGNPAVRVWVNEPNVIGYVRRKPGAGHAVIHLVDWNETPAPFEVTFDPLALVGAPAADVRVLQPKAEPIVIKAYQGRTLVLPALDPWALLVVTPAATPSADLPEPRLTAPLRGVVPAGTVAKFTDPGEGHLIVARYLPDGEEGNPQFVSLGNDASLSIPSAGVVEAMTRHVGSGQESAVMRVRFETFEDYSAEPHEWAGRSGIDLSDRFRVSAGEILVNGSFLADEMQLVGNKVERGISGLGDVVLTTPVEPDWEIFTVRVGIDDAEDRRPCVRFQVLIDGKLAYETPIINPTKQQIANEQRVEYSIAVRIPEGTRSLQLRAINGGFFKDQNHSIWAEPTVYTRE